MPLHHHCPHAGFVAGLGHECWSFICTNAFCNYFWRLIWEKLFHKIWVVHRTHITKVFLAPYWKLLSCWCANLTCCLQARHKIISHHLVQQCFSKWTKLRRERLVTNLPDTSWFNVALWGIFTHMHHGHFACLVSFQRNASEPVDNITSQNMRIKITYTTTLFRLKISSKEVTRLLQNFINSQHSSQRLATNWGRVQ